MRLLYYSPAMNELVGAGTHARGLVHGFHALGHDVMTVPELTPDEFVRSTPGRYSRVPDPVKRPARELRGRLAAARRGKELVSAAAAFEPDMVVARRYSYDLLLDRLVASLPVPVIAEVNAVLSIEVEGWGERLTAAEQRRERRFLANAQRLVCVSAEVAASVVDFGVDASDLRVVHNGFDDATFHSRVKPDPATVRWAEGFENVVGYCGTATNHHDMETLVDAAGRDDLSCTGRPKEPCRRQCHASRSRGAPGSGRCPVGRLPVRPRVATEAAGVSRARQVRRRRGRRRCILCRHRVGRRACRRSLSARYACGSGSASPARSRGETETWRGRRRLGSGERILDAGCCTDAGRPRACGQVELMSPPATRPTPRTSRRTRAGATS
jgi:hypothetical protein